MNDINELLNLFLVSNPIRGNSWLENEFIRVYVRRSRRLLNNEIFSSIDIANVIVNEKYLKQHIFKNFILFCESLDNVYVESVLNPELENMLIKNNYTRHEIHTSSFYKLK